MEEGRIASNDGKGEFESQMNNGTIGFYCIVDSGWATIFFKNFWRHELN